MRTRVYVHRARPSRIPGFTILFFIIAFAHASIYLATTPPAAVSEEAPADEFSSGRAMRHVRVIAAEPHPIGSEANRKVAQYLIEELRALGIEPLVHEANAENPKYHTSGRVYNVMGRIIGHNPSKAVLLMAHYDSVPQAPGAADNAAAVAVILETARAILSGPGLKNDVILLFTDGEEVGLLGAIAFQSHPWMDDVGLVMNFEARGTRGVSIMFETSEHNGRLIRELSKAAPYPYAPSWAVEVYKRMPYDTDFTIFRKAGIPGYNFAFIGAGENYHSPRDNVDNLDERSLQHHGTYAVSLTRHFGNMDLNQDLRSPNAVSFNVLNAFVYYPGWVPGPAAVIISLASAALLVLGMRRKWVTIGGLILGTLGTLVAIAVSGGLALMAQMALLRAASALGLSRPFVYASMVYVAGFMALGAGISIGVLRLTGRLSGLCGVIAGGIGIWVVLALATGFLVPGASYMILWPLMFALTGLVVTGSEPDLEHISAPGTLVLALSAAPVTLLWAPSLYYMGVAMGLWMAPAIAGIMALPIAIIYPQVFLISVSMRHRLALLLCGLSLALFAAGTVMLNAL